MPPRGRGSKDKILERYGLLNYQTKDKSQAEIAAGYARMAENGGPQVDEKWFSEQYGGGPTPQQMQGQSRQQQEPRQQGAVPTPNVGAGNVQYSNAPNGLLVKVTQGRPQVLSRQQAEADALLGPDPKFIPGASLDDALSGKASWTDVSVADRKKKLTDPLFYKNNEITKYMPAMQQQILADPSFDWKQVPAWQKPYFEMSSRPAVMGAAQGLVLGAGNPRGPIAGAILGSAAGWAGYDQRKEWWQQGEGKWTWDKQQIKDSVNAGFGLFNWLAEQAEKTLGVGFQVANAATDPNKQVADLFKDPKATWNAGANFGEVFAPAFISVMEGDGKFTAEDVLKIGLPPLYVLAKIGELIKSPEKYKGEELYLGANSPIQLDQSWIERIDQAREEIKAGRDYREVMTEMQTGIAAQLGDMAVQGIADPLNFLPGIETKVGTRIAEAGGHDVAAQALKTSGGLVEAGQKYKTLVQTGQALTIDPNFKVDQMGLLSRMVAGVNQQGEVKAGSLIPSDTGLFDPIKKKTGFIQNMAEQTPYSRAQTGAGMFYENIGTLLTMFDDPHDAGKYLSALAKGDNETWAQLGTRFAESPEFYTILPALKAFDAEKLAGTVQAWDMSAPNREMLTTLADLLGENPATLLDDLAKRGTSQQDFARVVERLKNSTDPKAQAMLADVEAGKFTVETLKQTVDIFSGEGALPYHPGQWKALMLDQLGSHFDEWVSKRLMLDKSPEAVSAFFRTTALLKQAQSILLLGGSPGYAITNGLSNMVHRAATGIYGYLTPNQINGFMERMGVTPARIEEGVGIGGQVEMASGKSKVKMDAMSEAVKGKGALTTAKNVLGKISKGMPFSKLSSWFEKTESKQAYVIGMKQFWSQSWRRGVGFTKMTPELTQAISDSGYRPDQFYAAIEAGMNQGEIEKALFGQFEGVQARSLVNDAAQKTGMKASDAATLLDQIGVLDTLDAGLKGKTTREGVETAFRRARQQAQDWADIQTGEDLKAMAESVKQRVGLEGAAAALDVAQKATGAFTDAWMDHYSRFGDVMTDLKFLGESAQRNKAIDLNYQISDGEFRRVYARHAANYKGIFDVWGLSKNPDALNVLAAIGEQDTAMLNAYRTMREIRKGFFDTYLNDWNNPKKWDDWEAGSKRIDKAFKDGFAAKHQAEVKQGAALAKIYESQYGPAAGEAAHLWWEDVTKFNEEIVKREQDFRKSLEGLTREERAPLKQEYYSKDKIAMIAEVERINGEGIARLERVIKKGGGAEGGMQNAPPSPTSPPVADATSPQMGERNLGGAVPDEVNSLLAAAEQRKGAEAKAHAERLASIWDVAENYPRMGLPYDRAVLQDKFALLGALRKPEYGGLADLNGMNDPRLTPEMVTSVLEARKIAKEAQAAQQVTQAIVNAQDAASNVRIPKIGDNTSILAAVKEHGGLNKMQALDITGEKQPKSAPGVFTSKGVNIDEMARMLADDGYPIDLNDPNDPGGIQQATALINRQRNGDKVYPMSHDHDAMIARAQDKAAAQSFADSFDMANVQEVPFDQALWQTEFADTISRADLTRMYELIGDFPEELSNTLTPEGETFTDFMSRVSDETAARVEADAREQAVADHATRAEAAITEAEVRAEAVTTRNLLKEQFQDVFKLSEEQATAYMELSDAVIGTFAKMTGENADSLYARYYEDVVRTEDRGPRTEDGGLQQEGSTAPKGAVTFDQAGIKATIHAFEAADFTTLVHENAHVFRRMLKDVATRTDNPYIKADLITIEEWAGVKDGAWNKAAEEKFARGFERYLTDGKAPTPKLARAFEMFKGWMLDIYKTITGSQIDVKMSDDVRGVFDRMLGGESLVEKINQGGDKRLPVYEQIRKIWDTLDQQTRDDVLKRSFTDPTTGLETKGAKALAGEKPVGWVEAYSDLNALKWVNDNLSHEAGDAVLARLGRIVVDEVDAAGGRAFRDGEGDEMSYWFPTQEAAAKAMQAIDEQFYQAEIIAGGQTWHGFSISYGLGENKAAADAAMYVNKDWNTEQGRRTDERGGRPQSIQAVEKKRQMTEDRSAGLFQKAEPIETPAFKNWFGESKVVDENGRPMVVYHGTNAKFDVFNKKQTLDTGDWGEGFYFTPSDAEASYYSERAARLADGQETVMPVYLRIENPYIIKRPDGGTSIQAEPPNTEMVKSKGYDGIIVKDAEGNIDEIVAFESNQIKSTANQGTFDPADPNILFQAEQPFGAYDAASGFHPQSEVQDQGWAQYVKPLMDAMQEGAINQLGEKPLDGATRDMSPEGQAMLKSYMRQVQGEMASTKLATIRHGESKRDFSMLNYTKRYGFDRVVETGLPYELYQTRTMANWFMRGIDKPAFYSNFARAHNQANRYERDIPERLRNKIKIKAPWLPEWAGDSLYIDPIGQLFPPANLLRPFDRMMQESNFQQIEAERILQEWAADGTYSDTEIRAAAQSRSGSVYERAFAEAKVRREGEINNPFDFFNAMFGAAWYLTTPMKLAQGKGNEVTTTPLYNTIRGIDTVTQGTWAEPVGDLIGMLGKPEEWARKKLNIPEFGEYGDYYIDRQLANMVAEGAITSEQAQIAMVERQGDLFTQAEERVKMELALRVPTMGALYAGLHGGVKAGAQAALPSLFGAGLLPAGELEYRGLKQEWNEAWAQKDKGNDGAITRFFDEHPEYEAYLAKGKKPEERLKSFLIGQIWDGYMALGTTNQRQARAEMGESFQQSFLDKETRSYDTLDVETLTQWAQMLGKKTPVQTVDGGLKTAVPANQQAASQAPKLDLYDPSVTGITDQFFEQRTERYPNWYEQQQGYYALASKGEKTKYLIEHPDLKKYWNWKDGWYDAYPQYQPIFNGNAFDRVDTSTWPPMLEDFVRMYAMTGQRLPSGAYKSLEQVWITEGQPMGDFQSWLDSAVVPGMMYQGQ